MPILPDFHATTPLFSSSVLVLLYHSSVLAFYLSLSITHTRSPIVRVDSWLSLVPSHVQQCPCSSTVSLSLFIYLRDTTRDNVILSQVPRTIVRVPSRYRKQLNVKRTGDQITVDFSASFNSRERERRDTCLPFEGTVDCKLWRPRRAGSVSYV